MKSIIIKSMLTLLLIIEFYPIESNSQPTTETSIYQINNENEESVYGGYELMNPGPMEMLDLTNIKFSILNKGNVNLNVYDENGKLIETLVEGEMEAGEYNVIFKIIEGLLPGEYYYVFNKDGITEIVRMFLPKY